jgi:hypothetical protein
MVFGTLTGKSAFQALYWHIDVSGFLERLKSSLRPSAERKRCVKEREAGMGGEQEYFLNS